MITEVNVGEIDRSSDFNEKSFGFISSPKGFKILTSKLYENPPYSVIQELSANAYDSHVQAKCPEKQFVVHLPTKLEPFFSIRDFGVSMDHEFMLTKYTLVFYSTKIADNDTNGAWGLGRLTGLACSDTYLVYTFLDGKRRTYNIFINEKGVPAIAHINTDDTTEPNGVEVNIPVPDQKINDFVHSAEKIYRNYSIKPIFKGYQLNLPKYEFTLQGTNWAIERTHTHPIAVMGVYHYPINHRSIPKLTTKQVQILSTGFFLTYNIGDLDVTASRDGLSYEEKTNKAIIDRLNTIMAEFDTKIQAEFDKCKTLIEAYHLHYTYFDYYGEKKVEGNLCSDKFVPVWQGIKINTHNIPINTAGVKLTTFAYSLSYKSGVSKHNEYKIEFRGAKAQVPDIYINDLPNGNGVVSRVRAAFEALSSKSGKYIHVLSFDTPELKEKFFTEHNFDKLGIKNISIIPKPVSPERAKSVKVYTEKSFKKVFKFNVKNAAAFKASDAWEVADADLDTGTGVYVVLDRYMAFGDSNYRTPLDIKAYIDKVSPIDSSISTLDVYGIKISQKDKIGKGWKTLTEHIQELVKAKIAALNIDNVYKGYLNYQQISGQKSLQVLSNFNLAKNGLKTNTVLHKIVTIVEKEKKLHDEFNRYNTTFGGFLTLPSIKVDVSPMKLENELFVAYPLYKNIVDVSYYYGIPAHIEKPFVEYANALDR